MAKNTQKNNHRKKTAPLEPPKLDRDEKNEKGEKNEKNEKTRTA